MAYKIIIQGEQGAYSHLAAIKIFKKTSMVCCKTFEDAFVKAKSIKNSKLLIPIENSIAGRVADIHYLLSASRLKIEGEHFQKVEHCLLGLKNTSIKQIERVRSHAQAIGQCKKNIQKLKLQPIVAADTAGSARYISEQQIDSESAIASALAAKIYGLKILKKNFEYQKGNVTRFLIMSGAAKLLFAASMHTPYFLHNARSSRLPKKRSIPLLCELFSYCIKLARQDVQASNRLPRVFIVLTLSSPLSLHLVLSSPNIIANTESFSANLHTHTPRQKWPP